MFVISIVLLFLHHIADIEGTSHDAPSCGDRSLGYEFNEQTGHCYKFHTQSANWTTAQWVCAGEGAHLSVINNDAEATYLKNLFEQYPPAAIHGISDPTFANHTAVGFYWDAGTWRTVDGHTLEQVGYAQWVQGRPTENEKYPYGFINRNGILNQGSVDFKFAFICEKAPLDLCW